MPTPRFTETPQGEARIETYTVVHEQGAPSRGIVIGRLNLDDTRFIANTLNDPEALATMVEKEMLGAVGQVVSEDGKNTFTPTR